MSTELSERNALIQAGQNRRLTAAEGVRLAALTWTPDPTMEHARLVRDRAPDLYPLVKVNPAAAAEYDRVRAAAQAGGRFVPEPDEATIDALDAAAAEWRAVMAEKPPATWRAIDAAHRPAFRAAIAKPDMNAALIAWQEWMAGLAKLDDHTRREQAARGALGLPSGFMRAVRPAFLRELEQALGGPTSLPTFMPGPGPERA